MTNINTMFPSAYIKCEDLQGRSHIVKMSHVKIEKIGDDPKPVLYYLGKERGMVLNRTNANTIAILYGDDTDQWGGREIEIYPTEVDFQGKRVPAIRVRMPSRQVETTGFNGAAEDRIVPNARTRAAQAPQYDERNPPPAKTLAEEMDDSIPF